MSEIKIGRRPCQISSNGLVHFIQTPEKASDFASRITTNVKFDRERDRLAVVDVGRGKAHITGNFDCEVRDKFPEIVIAATIRG